MDFHILDLVMPLIKHTAFCINTCHETRSSLLPAIQSRSLGSVLHHLRLLFSLHFFINISHHCKFSSLLIKTLHLQVSKDFLLLVSPFVFNYVPCTSFLGNPLVSSDNDENLSENSSSFVLLWGRERDNRNYSMINCDTGVFHTHEQKCPGHRVLCMTRVENRTWLGTEVRY